MKLYVWTEVLSDYTDGIMFALADSPEHAKSVIVDQAKQEYGRYIDEIARELDAKEPQAFDQPIGFIVFGGA